MQGEFESTLVSVCVLHDNLVMLGRALDNTADGDDCIHFAADKHLLDCERHIVSTGHIDALGHFGTEECGVSAGPQLQKLGMFAVILCLVLVNEDLEDVDVRRELAHDDALRGLVGVHEVRLPAGVGCVLGVM